MVFMEHFATFARHLQACMENIMTGSRSFKEPGMAFSRGTKNIGGAQVFGALAIVLLQYATASCKWQPTLIAFQMSHSNQERYRETHRIAAPGAQPQHLG
jgi:hypothetical protein